MGKKLKSIINKNRIRFKYNEKYFDFYYIF